jgi:hypothetical protein
MDIFRAKRFLFCFFGVTEPKVNNGYFGVWCAHRMWLRRVGIFPKNARGLTDISGDFVFLLRDKFVREIIILSFLNHP